MIRPAESRRPKGGLYAHSSSTEASAVQAVDERTRASASATDACPSCFESAGSLAPRPIARRGRPKPLQVDVCRYQTLTHGARNSARPSITSTAVYGAHIVIGLSRCCRLLKCYLNARASCREWRVNCVSTCPTKLQRIYSKIDFFCTSARMISSALSIMVVWPEYGDVSGTMTSCEPLINLWWNSEHASGTSASFRPW